MINYESAFLGLILAGVLLMVIGLGLMIPSAGAPATPPIAEKRLIEHAPTSMVRASTDKRAMPRSDSRPGVVGPKG